MPTTKTPADYCDRTLPRVLNGAIDGAEQGPAHEALLGESVALAAEQVLGGPSHARTPLGYLAHSAGHYLVLSARDGRRRDV